MPPLHPSPRAGLLAFAVIALVFAIMLAAAMLNSKLITGQQSIDRVDKQVTQAHADHDRLRLEVATLESPARIVLAAQAQGMIPAAQTIWVLPVVPQGSGGIAPTVPSTAPPSTAASRGPSVGAERAAGPVAKAQPTSQPQR